MITKNKCVLVVGFNTRPLAESLTKAGYEVVNVDFFGDLDLYPYVKDAIVIIKKMETDYGLIKDDYRRFLTDFSVQMIKKHKEIDFILIGSGLDDALEERKLISSTLKSLNANAVELNNDLQVFQRARDIRSVYSLLSSKGFKVPLTLLFQEYLSKKIEFPFPFVLKKKTSSGGLNVYKIEDTEGLKLFIDREKIKGFDPTQWLIQEYIEGLSVSCTTISNGTECELITINRQLLGLKLLNAPKEYMYCGNIVPANLLKDDNTLLLKISTLLNQELGLKGINGFDFVMKNHCPYLMEINPRIPGSISASESVLNLNLLDLHIRSFIEKDWSKINQLIRSSKCVGFATKLIVFASKNIDAQQISQINDLEFVHDKSDPVKPINKSDPICTILFKAKDFNSSYFEALKIANRINEIVEKTI